MCLFRFCTLCSSQVNSFCRFFHRIPIAILRHLFVQFVHQWSLLDSVDFTEWYIDGTKMEANANHYTFVRCKRVEKGIVKLKEKRWPGQAPLQAVPTPFESKIFH